MKSALNKAIENGFKWEDISIIKPTLEGKWISRIEVGNTCIMSISIRGNSKKMCSFYDVIFNPSFAKAFFGTEEIWEEDFNCAYPEWLFNLQVMVSKEDPIAYLKDFL